MFCLLGFPALKAGDYFDWFGWEVERSPAIDIAELLPCSFRSELALTIFALHGKKETSS